MGIQASVTQTNSCLFVHKQTRIVRAAVSQKLVGANQKCWVKSARIPDYTAHNQNAPPRLVPAIRDNTHSPNSKMRR